MDSLKALAWLLVGMVSCVCAAMVLGSVEQQIITHKVPSVSAQCRDGTYSTSKRDTGTCSRHGGVKVWIVR